MCWDNPLVALPPLPQTLMRLFCAATTRLPETPPLALNHLAFTEAESNDDHVQYAGHRWRAAVSGQHAADRQRAATVLPPLALLYV